MRAWDHEHVVVFELLLDLLEAGTGDVDEDAALAADGARVGKGFYGECLGCAGCWGPGGVDFDGAAEVHDVSAGVDEDADVQGR